MKRSYLVFSKKLIFFFLMLIAVDLSLGKLLEYFFLKINAGETSRITYSVSKANEEMIVLGSSRANHHYNTKILEDSLGFTCYNTGQDGEGILYHYGILKCILSRTAPKNIILDFNVNEFSASEVSYNRLSYLLPHYRRHKEVQPIVNLRGPFEKVKALSSLYRFNSYLPPIVMNNVIRRKERAYNGYLPLDAYWHKQLGEGIVFTDSGELDSVKISFFESFIRDAQKKNCNMIVLVSPFFQEIKEVPKSIKIAEEICRRNGVRFINYSQSALFLQHQEYFADVEHLNKTGAEVYTKMVAGLFPKKESIDNAASSLSLSVKNNSILNRR